MTARRAMSYYAVAPPGGATTPTDRARRSRPLSLAQDPETHGKGQQGSGNDKSKSHCQQPSIARRCRGEADDHRNGTDRLPRHDSPPVGRPPLRLRWHCVVIEGATTRVAVPRLRVRRLRRPDGVRRFTARTHTLRRIPCSHFSVDILCSGVWRSDRFGTRMEGRFCAARIPGGIRTLSMSSCRRLDAHLPVAQDT